MKRVALVPLAVVLVVVACGDPYAGEVLPSSPEGPDAATATSTGPLPSCANGERLCFGVCKRRDDPLVGCAAETCVACDPKNAEPAVCKGGATGFACDYASCRAGFLDCDGDRSNGCEASAADPRHCGACDRACSAATPFCVALPGQEPTCAAACPLGTTTCGGSCVHTASDLENCGACGTPCVRANAAAKCAGGACEFACNRGTRACGGACVPADDPATCLKCTPCPSRPFTVVTCAADACVYACAQGHYDCNGLDFDGCESTEQECGAASGN